jgi:hypothetical protein
MLEKSFKHNIKGYGYKIYIIFKQKYFASCYDLEWYINPCKKQCCLFGES